MSDSTTTSYRSVFTHEDCTKIHGEPTFQSLKLLSRELKTNARSVHSNLGGGSHGHLGIVLTPAQYALISATPFVVPAYPDPLVVPAGTVRNAADELIRNHKEALRLFREVLGVTNALKQQISKAVDSTYLDAIRSTETYELQGTVTDIIQYLMTTYGRVTPEQLADQYEQVLATVYSPGEPLDVIFNKVFDLTELAEAAQLPYSEQQQITILYTIFNRSGQFVHDIRMWKRMAPIDRTMINFKVHFRRAHEEIRETTNETLEALQQANLARRVVEEIQNQIPDLIQPANEPAPDLEAQALMAAQAQAQALAASTTQDAALLPSLLQQMTTMQTMMMQMQSEMNRSTGNGGRNGGRGNGGRGNGGRGNGAPRVRNPAHHTHYCWTHGACRHASADCNAPATGHQNAATATNHMGGSTRNVL